VITQERLSQLRDIYGSSFGSGYENDYLVIELLDEIKRLQNCESCGDPNIQQEDVMDGKYCRVCYGWLNDRVQKLKTLVEEAIPPMMGSQFKDDRDRKDWIKRAAAEVF
jgi:hypothetical protein